MTLVVSLTGCVSSSIQTDLSRVRTLSKSEAPLPALPTGKVTPEVVADTDELLKQPLDVERAVRVAILNNRDLRARLRALGVERGQLMQAGLLKNPTLEAEVAPERNSRVEVRTEYDVMSFVLTPLRKQAAARELEAARFDAAGDVVELGYEVRSAFYALAAAEQRVRMASLSLDALAAGRDAAQALFDAGNINQLDASTQISAFERARVIVAKLELEAIERREHMQRLLGLFGRATQWSLASELAVVPETPELAEDLEARAIEASLDRRAQEQQLEALAKRAGIARTEGWLPRLDVDVHTLVGDPLSSTENQLRWGGGVGLDVPLFDRQQGLVRAIKAELDSRLEQYQGLGIELRSKAREVSARVVSAHRRARLYQSVIVPAQAKVMEHTVLQYNAMQVGVFQLLEARRGELEVALDYTETLREYWTARAELDALLAGRVVHEEDADEEMPSFEHGASARGGH
ncbi:MAG: TolC family protein [Myxococcales bacterium]